MNLNALVVEKLIQWKEDNDETNRTIAEKLGVSDALIGQYFNKQKQLPNTRFEQVAALLDISLDELLSDGPDPYTVHLRGKISNFAGELGLDRVISHIERNYL